MTQICIVKHWSLLFPCLIFYIFSISLNFWRWVPAQPYFSLSSSFSILTSMVLSVWCIWCNCKVPTPSICVRPRLLQWGSTDRCCCHHGPVLRDDMQRYFQMQCINRCRKVLIISTLYGPHPLFQKLYQQHWFITGRVSDYYEYRAFCYTLGKLCCEPR